MAPASTPKIANSASGPECTPADDVKMILFSCSSVSSAACTVAPPPAAIVCTQRRCGLASTTRRNAAASTSGMPYKASARPAAPRTLLLLLRPGERRVAGKVGRVSHRRQELRVVAQLDPRFPLAEQLGYVWRHWCGDRDTEAVHMPKYVGTGLRSLQRGNERSTA